MILQPLARLAGSQSATQRTLTPLQIAQKHLLRLKIQRKKRHLPLICAVRIKWAKVVVRTPTLSLRTLKFNFSLDVVPSGASTSRSCRRRVARNSQSRPSAKMCCSNMIRSNRLCWREISFSKQIIHSCAVWITCSSLKLDYTLSCHSSTVASSTRYSRSRSASARMSSSSMLRRSSSPSASSMRRASCTET